MDHATSQPGTAHPTSAEDICRTPLTQLVTWPDADSARVLSRVLGDRSPGRRTEATSFQSAI